MGRGLQKPAKDGEAAVDVPSLVGSPAVYDSVYVASPV